MGGILYFGNSQRAVSGDRAVVHPARDSGSEGDVSQGWEEQSWPVQGERP